MLVVMANQKKTNPSGIFHLPSTPFQLRVCIHQQNIVSIQRFFHNGLRQLLRSLDAFHFLFKPIKKRVCNKMQAAQRAIVLLETDLIYDKPLNDLSQAPALKQNCAFSETNQELSGTDDKKRLMTRGVLVDGDKDPIQISNWIGSYLLKHIKYLALNHT